MIWSQFENQFPRTSPPPVYAPVVDQPPADPACTNTAATECVSKDVDKPAG